MHRPFWAIFKEHVDGSGQQRAGKAKAKKSIPRHEGELNHYINTQAEQDIIKELPIFGE